MKQRIVNPKFIERCNLLKEEKNLKLDEIESQIGVSKGTMSKYLNGIHLPNSEVIKNLSKLFDVSADYLLGGSDERKNSRVDASNLPGGYVEIVIDAINNGISEDEFRSMLEMCKKLKSNRG